MFNFILKGIFIFFTIIAIGVMEVIYALQDQVPACEKMPMRTIKEVQQLLEEHDNTRQQIEQLSPSGSISLMADDSRCPGRAEILIYYGSERQKKLIKKNIGETFFGVPYRMFNV